MNQQQFRAVLVLLLAIVVAFGLYLGWHFTHQPKDCYGTTATGRTAWDWGKCPSGHG